jgi:ABC-type multidrug transport system permease subunit
LRCSRAGTKVAPTRLTGAQMGWIFGIIYFVLLVTLGVLSLRKGHWIMFIVGLFIPLFWLIGALLPRRVARM